MAGRRGGVLLAAALLVPFGGKAHRKTEEGNAHYRAGELERALGAYTEAQVTEPEAAELHYDIGNVLYRQEDWEGAAEAYERALVNAGPELRGRASYNLGNARFRQERFPEAAEAYRRALEAAPDDRDAKRNLELSLRAMAQQPPQPSPQPDGEQRPDQQPQAGSSGPEGPEPSPPATPEENPSPQAGLTREQAERLLDGAADAERQGLEEERRRAPGGAPRREKDW